MIPRYAGFIFIKLICRIRNFNAFCLQDFTHIVKSCRNIAYERCQFMDVKYNHEKILIVVALTLCAGILFYNAFFIPQHRDLFPAASGDLCFDHPLLYRSAAFAPLRSKGIALPTGGDRQCTIYIGTREAKSVERTLNSVEI